MRLLAVLALALVVGVSSLACSGALATTTGPTVVSAEWSQVMGIDVYRMQDGSLATDISFGRLPRTLCHEYVQTISGPNNWVFNSRTQRLCSSGGHGLSYHASYGGPQIIPGIYKVDVEISEFAADGEPRPDNPIRLSLTKDIR